MWSKSPDQVVGATEPQTRVFIDDLVKSGEEDINLLFGMELLVLLLASLLDFSKNFFWGFCKIQV
jgi:hypothetical protein